MSVPVLQQSLTYLKGIGSQLATKLARLDLHTLQDCLFHLPLRYQDRTRIVPINSLRIGDEAVIEAEVQFSEVVFRRRRSLLCHLADGNGLITLRFFYFNRSQQENLKPGTRLRCFGEVRAGTHGLEMIHPEYRIVTQDITPVEENLTPVYPTTEGVSQAKLRQLTERALTLLNHADTTLIDYLPDSLRQEYQLPELQQALNYVHRPPPDASINQLTEGLHPTQQRLAFEELLAHQLSLRILRVRMQKNSAPKLKTAGRLQQQLQQQLPFQLTAAQQRVIQEALQDLAKPYPALRLIQGDVGCGKTLVAIMLALTAVEAGYQAAIMAPTELLAEQHYRNLQQWLIPLNCQIGWLAGKTKGKKREATLAELKAGSIQIMVGTHALFQEHVEFKQLGLLIIDEQHRFGVHQRLALQQKGIKQNHYPHQITMTATPIPRTLAMTAYADLDYSVIDELPPGRTPVNTTVVAEQRRADVIQRIAHACQSGQQVYWVCPLIEESEVLQCQTAEDTYRQLQQQLPGLKLGLVHGRLKARDKEALMQGFQQGEIQLLVATTVIEVGVDVPNASLMIIENAERFGLAQLHQLRGRVGRGQQQSHCVLLYKSPLSDRAKKRLQIMREQHDGFKIAQEDLQIRGPGELLGTRQTGLITFRIADLNRDTGLLPDIQRAAQLLQQQYPELITPLINRWLGQKQQFRHV